MSLDEIGGTATYAGLGAAVLGLVGWFLVAVVKQSVKRTENEGNLDARVTAMVDMVTKPLNAIIDEERAEKRRAQDERDKIVGKFIDYTTETQARHADELNKLREDNKVSNQRLHDRLDETDKKHLTCETRLGDALRRLDNMEQTVARSSSPVSLTVTAPAAAPAAPVGVAQ